MAADVIKFDLAHLIANDEHFKGLVTQMISRIADTLDGLSDDELPMEYQVSTITMTNLGVVNEETLAVEITSEV